MVFDPVSKTILNEIDKQAKFQKKEKKEKKEASPYWVKCPSCGRWVVKKELIKKGCFLCGWNGNEESNQPYRVHCNNCRRVVLREELIKKGCYICGWRPQKLERNKEKRMS